MALSPAQRAFLHGEVSVSIAASDSSTRRSSVVRVLGSHASDDGQQLRLLVDRGQAADPLRWIAASGRMAVVYTEPLSHRSLQIKSTDARVLPPDAEDLVEAARHPRQFTAAIGAVGWPPAHMQDRMHAAATTRW